MKACPNCRIDLRIADRQGVEIDYCPQCRGVWLDRGELDKIIDRSAALGVGPRRGDDDWKRRDWDDDDDDERRRDWEYHDRGYPPRKKKREGFLGDLFDF